MDRKELYAKIKELNLQDEIKNAFGANYTNVKTFELQKFVLYKIEKCEVENKETNTDKKEDTIINTRTKTQRAPIDVSFIRLIQILADKHILLDSEVKKIMIENS